MKSAMPFLSAALGLALISFGSDSRALEVPTGFGQLENPPVLIPGGIDEEGRSFHYFGQAATGGKLILTASNGFFTHGVATAKGESDLPKMGDDHLIGPNFAYLEWTEVGGTLRWHLLVKEPGKVHFRVDLEVSDPGSEVEVSFADLTRKVVTGRAAAGQGQDWKLSFEVPEPGAYEFSLKASKRAAGSIGKLHRVEAFGPGLAEAHLLRTRWRPAAVHGGYDRRGVDDAKLLVFTTRSVSEVSSYSPITTPFGYYGTSFESRGRSKGSFNFSMWGPKGADRDLKVMPHLLGVGSPEGLFSGFGHEGTGVKPRGWVPMPDLPEVVVQALRVENHDLYDTYYGYYFDHPTQAWKFFAAGNKWHGGKPLKHLRLGSFCEVPGPPQRERSGDLYREVRRRGWVWREGQWLALDTFSPGGNGRSGELPVNKLWDTTREGEYAMGCGGMRFYRHDPARVRPVEVVELPPFLSSPSVATLFTLPITFGRIQATEVSSAHALIEFNLTSDQELGAGTLYFGPKDALTFAPRQLHGTEQNSSLSRAVQEMAWPSEVKIPKLKPGINRVILSGLDPATTYHYRILAENTVSRIWNDRTHSLTTPGTSAGPVKITPLIPNESDEGQGP